MTIDTFRVYQIDLSLEDGRRARAGGRFIDVFDLTVSEDDQTGIG